MRGLSSRAARSGAAFVEVFRNPNLRWLELAWSATSVWMLAAAQLPNAVMIAAASGLGITYFQDMMPGYPGRATTMFTNTFPIGQILAAPLFGLAVEFGFRLAYGLNLTLSVLGLLLLLLFRPPAATAGSGTAVRKPAAEQA